MASSGPRTASVGSGAGFTNPGNVANTTLAYFSAVKNNETSDTLLGTGFGFSIPVGATINGIVASYNGNMSMAGGFLTMNTVGVYLTKAGTYVGATLKYGSTTWVGTATTFTLGTSSDLWGTTWSYSDINNSGFGMMVTPDVSNASTTTAYSVYLGYYQITVYYTVGGANYVTTCTCT